MGQHGGPDLAPVVLNGAGASGTDASRAADALLAAYDAHQRGLYSYLLAATRDPNVAADLLQETFLRYLREAQADRLPVNAHAWLFRVATNLVMSGGRRQRTAARWAERQPRADVAGSAEDEILRRERDRELLDSLDELPEDGRTALLMAAQGFSGAEIAGAIGKSESATRTLMCRARLRLRNRLADAEEGAWR